MSDASLHDSWVPGLVPGALDVWPRNDQRPRASEADCQETIVAAAKAAGWRVHAERAAASSAGRWSTPIQGHRGFPDLFLVHQTRGIVVVELKRRPNTVEPDQREWLLQLRAAGLQVCVWWVPEQLREALDFITGTSVDHG